jgi:hypothetical protein
MPEHGTGIRALTYQESEPSRFPVLTTVPGVAWTCPSPVGSVHRAVHRADRCQAFTRFAVGGPWPRRLRFIPQAHGAPPLITLRVIHRVDSSKISADMRSSWLLGMAVRAAPELSFCRAGEPVRVAYAAGPAVNWHLTGYVGITVSVSPDSSC